jgi:hypothetical protein
VILNVLLSIKLLIILFFRAIQITVCFTAASLQFLMIGLVVYRIHRATNVVADCLAWLGHDANLGFRLLILYCLAVDFPEMVILFLSCSLFVLRATSVPKLLIFHYSVCKGFHVYSNSNIPFSGVKISFLIKTDR